MSINCHAVGQLHALQSPFLVLGEYNAPAPRPVDMEPKVVFFTHCRNFREWVVGTEDSGTSTRIDVEGGIALGFGF